MESHRGLSGRGVVPLLHALAGDWRTLGLSGVVGAVLMIMALHLVTPQFTASMVVGPTGRSGPAAMGPRAPALMPAAGRGIAEPGSAEELVSDFSRYLALLTSVPVAERLAGDGELMHVLFKDSWDEEAGGWRPASGLTAVAGRSLRWLAGHETWAPPDAVDLSRHLKKYLSIESVSGGPLRRLVYRHDGRGFALLLLNRLHAAAEAHLRDEARRRLRAEMAHVGNRLSGVVNLEQQRSLVGMMADQEQTLMMLEVGLPYAADVLEAPSAPALADWPNPVLLVPAAMLAAIGLCLFVLSARHGWRRGVA